MKHNAMNHSISADPPSASPHQARWEVFMQRALELWFRTTCRQLARALHGTPHIDTLDGMSARQCRDLGLPPRESCGRDPHFVNAEAQLGMFR
jgi:hypothetical protein